MINSTKGSDLEIPINKSRGELIPADKFVLKQRSMLGRLDGLRGMTWAYAVLYHTGLTASTASKKFTPSDHPLPVDKNGNTAISNIMYQYLNGKRSPKIGPRGKLGFDLVGEIDKDPDGRLASPWLSHFMWEILHPDITLSKIRVILFSMPDDLKNLAFFHGTQDPMFGRVPDSRYVIDRLFSLETADAYAFTLAIQRESELIGDRAMNEYSLITLKMWQEVIASHEVLRYVYHPLQHFLNTFLISSKRKPNRELSEEDLNAIDQPRTWKRMPIGNSNLSIFIASDEDENNFLHRPLL